MCDTTFISSPSSSSLLRIFESIKWCVNYIYGQTRVSLK